MGVKYDIPKIIRNLLSLKAALSDEGIMGVTCAIPKLYQFIFSIYEGDYSASYS